MRTVATVRNRYEWLLPSLSVLALGLCAQWLMLFGGLPWQS